MKLEAVERLLSLSGYLHVVWDFTQKSNFLVKFLIALSSLQSGDRYSNLSIGLQGGGLF